MTLTVICVSYSGVTGSLCTLSLAPTPGLGTVLTTSCHRLFTSFVSSPVRCEPHEERVKGSVWLLEGFVTLTETCCFGAPAETKDGIRFFLGGQLVGQLTSRSSPPAQNRCPEQSDSLCGNNKRSELPFVTFLTTDITFYTGIRWWIMIVGAADHRLIAAGLPDI